MLQSKGRSTLYNKSVLFILILPAILMASGFFLLYLGNSRTSKYPAPVSIDSVQTDCPSQPRVEPTIQRTQDQQKDAASIPKHIWTYWDTESLPPFVQLCIEGWAFYNPDYTVTVLNMNNIGLHISEPIPANLTSMIPATQSDWIRLAVLKEHGGIWMDATMVVTGPLDFVMAKQQEMKSQGFMFHLNRYTSLTEFPVLESWFISSIPQGTFVTAWFKEFDWIVRELDGDGDRYLAHLLHTYGQERHDHLRQRIATASYLKIHIAAQKVMQIEGLEGIYSEAAEDEPFGPYILRARHHWNSKEYAHAFFKDYSAKVPRLSKIIGPVRAEMMRYLEDPTNTISDSSLYRRFLMHKTHSMRINTTGNMEADLSYLIA
jgi:Capsular polysaccharide synthesis protein